MKIHCTLNSQFPPMDSLFIPAPRNFPFSSVRVSFPFSLKKQFFFFGHAIWHVGLQFPDQGSNPFPLHWKLRVLTTGPPGKSLFLSFFFFNYLLGRAGSSLQQAGCSILLCHAGVFSCGTQGLYLQPSNSYLGSTEFQPLDHQRSPLLSSSLWACLWFTRAACLGSDFLWCF